ncbi:hypothetical protein, variant [Capsaspora owczarzaki ATCC 30864]|uniref:Ras-related protein Rab n=1 Tax=Capsaspora owczarzaki (strain ATCC 30864) TaxID=595528 RepID=A0A0D2X226_CAPO3|nr:hypothetical protein, variant [Capsaspora owczarzaki ATCC 30864]
MLLFGGFCFGDCVALTGKTSLIRRYSEGFFTPNYKLTIGADFATKVLEWESGAKITLQLWDIAGHERFGHMTHVYYKYAIAAVIVFDMTRPATFDSVIKWLNDVNNKVMLPDGKPVPVMLLANKADMSDKSVYKQKLDDFCKEHGLIGWFATSAKNNANIDQAMNFLVGSVIQISKRAPAELVKSPIEEFVRLSGNDIPTREQRQANNANDPMKQLGQCCS